MNLPKLRFKGENLTNFPNLIYSTLGNLCQFQQGVQIDLDLQEKNETDGYIKFLRIENYTQNSRDFRYIPFELSSNKLIDKDEIAIVRYGATAGFIARGLDGVLANNLFKLIVDKSKLTNDYLFQYLRTSKVFNFFQSEMAGGAMPALSFTIVKNLKLAIPSLQEQTKIANFLTAVDKKITQLTQKHELLNQYKKGVMQKIFSQELRFKDDGSSEFPEWQEVKIADVASLKNGYAFKSSTYSVNGKYKVLTIANVQDGCISLTSCNKVEEIPIDIANHQILNLGEILISMTGNVGRVAILNEENCLLNQRVGKFEIKNDIANKSFIYQVLLQDKFKTSMDSISQGGAQKNIGVSDILDYSLNLPCNKEQTKIANFLTAIDDKITATQSQLELVKQYKQGLLQQMFV